MQLKLQNPPHYVLDAQSLKVVQKMAKSLSYGTYTVQFTPAQGAVTIEYALTPNEITAFIDRCLAEGLIPACITIYSYPQNTFRFRRLFTYSADVEGE